MVGHKTLRKATSRGLPSGLVNLDLDICKMAWRSGRGGTRMACNGEAWGGSMNGSPNAPPMESLSRLMAWPVGPGHSLGHRFIGIHSMSKLRYLASRATQPLQVVSLSTTTQRRPATAPPQPIC